MHFFLHCLRVLAGFFLNRANCLCSEVLCRFRGLANLLPKALLRRRQVILFVYIHWRRAPKAKQSGADEGGGDWWVL